MAITLDIQLPHYPRGFHLVTRDIISHLPELPESGLLVVFIKHTSAGITINENADPDVRFPDVLQQTCSGRRTLLCAYTGRPGRYERAYKGVSDR